MEISKSKLLSLIVENHDIDIDEMAFRKKGVQAPKKDSAGNLILKKFEPFWKDGNDSEIPDYWKINPNQVAGEDKIIVPLDCQELEQFVGENKDWLNQIEADHGITPLLVACKRGKYQPRNTSAGTPYEHSGDNMNVRERILRYSGGKKDEGFYNIVRTKLEMNGDINHHLELCSIPAIKTSRTHIDRYAHVSNDSITFQTHSFDFYNTVPEFLKSVVKRVKGEIPDHVKGEYLARLFNLKYTKWEMEKKTDKKKFGKTDIYGLKKYGFEEDEINVMVSNQFSIFGQRTEENGFTWVINMVTKFGKKLQEDQRVKQLTQDKDIKVVKNVPSDPADDRKFNDNFTIMDKLSIKQGLIEALDEFVQKIMDISPKDALKLANMKKYDVKKMNEERQLNHLVSNVITEKIKKTR